MGQCGAAGNCRLSERFTAFAGPSLQYMLTSFLKVPDNAPYKASSEHPYFINMDAGLRVNL